MRFSLKEEPMTITQLLEMSDQVDKEMRSVSEASEKLVVVTDQIASEQPEQHQKTEERVSQAEPDDGISEVESREFSQEEPGSVEEREVSSPEIDSGSSVADLLSPEISEVNIPQQEQAETANFDFPLASEPSPPTEIPTDESSQSSLDATYIESPEAPSPESFAVDDPEVSQSGVEQSQIEPQPEVSPVATHREEEPELSQADQPSEIQEAGTSTLDQPDISPFSAESGSSPLIDENVDASTSQDDSESAEIQSNQQPEPPVSEPEGDEISHPDVPDIGVPTLPYEQSLGSPGLAPTNYPNQQEGRSGFQGFIDLPSVNQSELQDPLSASASDPISQHDNQIEKQFESQQALNRDFVSQLAQELGPSFDEMREFYRMSVQDYVGQQQIISSLLRANG